MLIGNRPRQQRKVPQRTGRRIIGQNAGHEIHLEIEDVLDNNKKKTQIEIDFLIANKRTMNHC